MVESFDGDIQEQQLQGYLAHKKQRPPQDHNRTLGIVLLQGPRSGGGLMREVPLYWTLGESRGGSMISLPKWSFRGTYDRRRML